MITDAKQHHAYGGMFLALGLGIILSLLAFNPSNQPKHDEGLYFKYCRALTQHGLGLYPELTAKYLDEMHNGALVETPPIRFAYIGMGALVHAVTGVDEHRALAFASLAAGIIALCWYSYFAKRIFPPQEAFAAVLLLACAPLRLFQGSKAMIDGYFAMWAMFTICSAWLSLTRPIPFKWIVAYIFSLTMLVLCKENAGYIWIFLVTTFIFGPRLGIPAPSPALWRATFLAPFLGIIVLALLAGGFEPLMDLVSIFVIKCKRNPYGILTGDGPWHCYLLDLFLLNPIALLVFFFGLSQVPWKQQPVFAYFACFLGITYLIMSQLKYGINLRFTSIWEFPMRILVVAGLATWTARFALCKRRALFYGVIFIICAQDLYQYDTFFIKNNAYELTPESMLRAVDVIKSTDEVRHILKDWK